MCTIRSARLSHASSQEWRKSSLSFAKILAVHGIRDLGKISHWPSVKILSMIPLLGHFLGWLIDAFRPRQDLILENLALRQQLMALHAKRPVLDSGPSTSSSGSL
jgi:hypothetical protein